MSEYKSKIELKKGHFYKARDNSIWCCFDIIKINPEFCQALCVNLLYKDTQYFRTDGRYDVTGNSRSTLIKDVTVEHVEFECVSLNCGLIK